MAIENYLRPISLNESSLRINLLHKAMRTLGFPANETEEKTRTAGKSTLEQVRSLQAKLHIKFDEKYVVDQTTFETLVDEMKKGGHTLKSNSFVVRGTVYNRNGEAIKRQMLIALDVDLRGAAVYRKVKSLKEIEEYGGFEYLSERSSDSQGNYYIEFFSFQFASAERKKADVIVYAINKAGEIIGRSKLVNSEEYSAQGEVRNIHVLISKKEERTEYEILMGKLNPFLKESSVNLIELADSKDQVKFTSGELDEKEIKIQIAVDAEVLRNKRGVNNTGSKKDNQKKEKYSCNCELLSHELLYGIGRQNITLNWLVLYKKTDAEITGAIAKSVKTQIIKDYSEKEIKLFIQIIHECAAEYVLKYKGANQQGSLAERLSFVLPKKEQQTAFISAYKSFKSQGEKGNIDARKFWSEYLPSQKEFKENPELIPALLLNQQLIILTGNHLLLIEALQTGNKISAITQLLDYSDKNWNELIDKSGVPDYISGNNETEKKTNYIGQLQSFINAAYPTQKIALMLAKGELPLKDANVAKGIQTFLSQNEKFEIGKTPVHEYAEELKKVAGENYENAKIELNRMQRVFQVSTSPKVMSVLMEKKLNSAHAIANYSKKNFVKMNSEALGGELVAEAVYQRAEHVSTLATERAMKMYELSHLAAPAYAFSKSDREEVVALMQEQVSKRHNPNYSEIFGSPDLCECEHCRSIYGAAAYFVDLLQFLAKSCTNDDFVAPATYGKSPLDLFKLRRPDLLNLPLTCENTNTLIPYIDLVNEVMEYYTCHGTMEDNAGDSASYDTGDTSADELRAAPQNFKIEAYEKLKDAVYPFNLPYHQPLDVIRTYSDHLKTERYDVMKGMQKVFDTATTRAIESEALRISEEEHVVLTGEEFDGTADGRTTLDYYGNPASMEMLAGFGISDGIHEFLRRTGVKYTDLVELIKTKFINPHQNKLDYLENFSVAGEIDSATLYTKLTAIKGGADLSGDASLISAMTKAGTSWGEFSAWVVAHFEEFNSVITLYQSNSSCELDSTYLVTIKKVYEASTVVTSGIPDATWSKMHRLIRLWRKLKWSIHEVDLMLAALGESDITPDTISKLSAVALLNKKLKLPLNKLATLWGNIDTNGDKSLYKKLFLNKTVLRLDNYFEANTFGNYLQPDAADTTKLADHIPAVLAAFRMSEEDLSAILEVAEIDDAGTSRLIDPETDKATLENLSVIYRYTVLSKILKLKVPDFCRIKKLFGINPFSTLSLPTLTFTNISPATTLSFYDLATSIKESGFKAEQLQYIFTGELPAESSIGLNEEKAITTLRTIREAFAAIEQEHPDLEAISLTSELVRNKLSLTFSSDVSSQLIAIAECAQTFTVDTEVGLTITITGSLATKYAYDDINGKLSCKGVMTESEKTALKNLVNATDAFKASIDSLSVSISTAINTYITFNIVTDINLPISIPETLSLKYSYIKSTGRLIVKGIMSDAEKTELKALAGATANYQSAVDTLYKLPKDFIALNFAGIFSTAGLPEAYSTLLNHPTQTNEATLFQKLDLIYRKYLPLLKDKLREDAMVNNIASLIGISQEATNILIKNNLDLIKGYVNAEGFSAKYFSDATFTTSVADTVEPTVNFDWGTAAPYPTVPADNFSVKWEAYISPPSSGEYTLTVEVKETDEAFNLYIDDVLISNKVAGSAGTSFDGLVSLNSSKLHKLKLEYSETTSNAAVSLYWQTNTTSPEIIPVEFSFPLLSVTNFCNDIKLFHQASKFINGFKLTDKEVNHFVNYSADFNAIDFKLLLPLHWQRINNYVVLRNAIPQSQALLTDVFASAKILNPVPGVDSLIALLNLATGWDVASITELATYYSLGIVNFINEVDLTKIYNAINFIQKTGLSVTSLTEWAKPETNFVLLNTTADLVRSTVKAKYEEEDWMKLAGDLSDKIRENQKQALISYLLTVPALIDNEVKDADSLYEYFLIDVQMGACMDTSRIVQATAAVQMFMQRCLLNLESDKDDEGNEKGVSPEYIDKDRWEWMKYYRVWEVNRKIFITPENWLEPEWRDDKSAFFKEMESELTQNDITDSSVETAFRNYLTKLNTVANLDVCGMYQEDNSDGTLKLLHVFGRTHNAPYQFFYRTCSSTYKWSPWEKVQLDIRMTEDSDNSGVHLVPVFWKDRLFVFWTEFIEKAQEVNAKNKNEDEATFEEISKDTPSSVRSIKYWEMRLAWSELVDSKWNPKQLTKEFVKVYSGFLTDPVKNIILKTEISNDILLIIPYARFKGEGGWASLDYFQLNDIQSKVIVSSFDVSYEFNYESAARYNSNFEKHNLDSALEFWNNTYFQNSINHNLVFSNSSLEKESDPGNPFFYQDTQHTYFVKPYNVSIWHAGKNPDLFYPFVMEFAEYYTATVPQIPGVDPDDYLPEHYFMNGDPTSEFAIAKDRLEMVAANSMNVKTISVSHKAKMMKAGKLGKTLSTGEVMQMKNSIKNYSKLENAFADLSNNYGIYKYFGYYLKEKGLEFDIFYHPYSSNFVSKINTGGIKELMDSDTLLNSASLLEYNDNGVTFDSTTTYNPDFTYLKKAPASQAYNALGSYTLYKENICFDMYGANSGYNWELFFHIPLYIATRLSKNGRYEEAMKWFHYIFDPTSDDASLPDETPTARFWKTLPFKTTPKQSIEEWFASIVGIDVDSNGENDMIQEWRDNPFKPFLVARNRPLAFMKNVVIKYVENLREWGDSLFRVFQREQVYEALQLYVMANHILGPRPEFVPKRGEIKAETYTSLAAKVLDDFSNAVVELENIFPYSSSVPVSPSISTPGLLGIGQALYFCIPSNSKLMEHWDTVADRLYKIRHCMDIDGVKRQLALFAPSIDPAMLINAAAQGLSLGSILSDLSSPPPIYRFNYLIQKANEFCGEVKSLGSTLLSALEKKDGEELSRLRSKHETMMLDLMTAIKERQVLDAKAGKEGLLKSRESAVFRLQHYNGLLSEESLTLAPPPTLDSNVNSESQIPNTTINEIVSDVDASLEDSNEGGIKLIPKEKSEIDDLNTARGWQIAAQATEGLAAIAHAIPTVTLDGKPFGVGPGADWGGPHLGNAISAAGKVLDFVAGFYTHSAIQAAKVASYIRREQDWTLQANLAAKEIIQLDKQIVSADIKIQISEKELLNHKQQIENSKEVEQFLKNKFTNQELYQWLKEQLFSVYKQSFNMAYDMAKKVEKCYQYELGMEPTNFIQYGYWDNTMQGLCAGEKLQLALRQLEKSYIEENKRELELTKSVSMALLNPLALQELRTTGKCFLSIPEELYDLDYQGHYFRRIKSVSVSLPCIAGPYTTVNCTLRLLKNNVRINTFMSDTDGTYGHNNEEGIWTDDPRFRESNIPVKAIATSTGQRDSGMFELSFNDPRYLPFEGAGAISEWKMELTQDVDLRQFDYSSISDVILHICYTAREDAGLFRERVVTYLKDFLSNAADLSTQPLMRMFSIKHEFSSEWHKFLYPSIAGSDQTLSVTLKKENFPFFTKNRGIYIKKVEVLLKANRSGDYKMVIVANDSDDNTLTSSEISMPENSTYANMQKATLTADSAGTVMINVEEIDVFKPIILKFRHSSDAVSTPQKYNQIDTDPEEISDLFVVFHYFLGDAL